MEHFWQPFVATLTLIVQLFGTFPLNFEAGQTHSTLIQDRAEVLKGNWWLKASEQPNTGAKQHGVDFEFELINQPMVYQKAGKFATTTQIYW